MSTSAHSAYIYITSLQRTIGAKSWAHGFHLTEWSNTIEREIVWTFVVCSFLRIHFTLARNRCTFSFRLFRCIRASPFVWKIEIMGPHAFASLFCYSQRTISNQLTMMRSWPNSLSSSKIYLNMQLCFQHSAIRSKMRFTFFSLSLFRA